MDKGHRLERFKQTWWTPDPPRFSFAPRYVGFVGDWFYLGVPITSSGLVWADATSDAMAGSVIWQGEVLAPVEPIQWTLVQTIDADHNTLNFELRLLSIINGLFAVALDPVTPPYQWDSDRATFSVASVVILNPAFDMYANQVFSTPNYWQVRHGVWP